MTVCGKDPPTMVSQMQLAIGRAEDWAAGRGLAFSAAKTQVVIFHRKRKPLTFPPLFMNGEELKYSKTAVYLGITLDTKLEYKPHLREKCKQGIRLYMALRGALGQLWGPSPKAMQWAYRPLYTRGCRTVPSFGRIGR